MPIYAYRCQKGHNFELLQNMSEDSLDRCIHCQAPAERVLFPPAIHFKGSGFYNTDYKNKKSEKPQRAAAEPSSEPKEQKAKAPEKKKKSTEKS
jgi:putative FmdB family regulatory protein